MKIILLPRNTYAECVDFIVADLDKAATLLDGKDYRMAGPLKTVQLWP